MKKHQRKFISLAERYDVEIWRKVARMYFISNYSPGYIARKIEVEMKESTVDLMVSIIMRRKYMLHEFCPEVVKITKRHFEERKQPFSINELDYQSKDTKFWRKKYKFDEVKLELPHIYL